MKFVSIIATCASTVLALLTSAFFSQYGNYLPIFVLAASYPLFLFLLEPRRARRPRRRLVRVVPLPAEQARLEAAAASPEPAWEPAVVLEPARRGVRPQAPRRRAGRDRPAGQVGAGPRRHS